MARSEPQPRPRGMGPLGSRHRLDSAFPTGAREPARQRFSWPRGIFAASGCRRQGQERPKKQRKTACRAFALQTPAELKLVDAVRGTRIGDLEISDILSQNTS